MTTEGLEARARELLAVEYDRQGDDVDSRCMRRPVGPDTRVEEACLRAIIAALTPSQPAEEVREAVAEALWCADYRAVPWAEASDIAHVRFRSFADAALSASPESVQKLTAERDELKLALAEADSKNDAMLHEWNSAEQLIHGVRAATIEECAKVADQAVADAKCLSALQGGAVRLVAGDIATAIRALAKEPR